MRSPTPTPTLKNSNNLNGGSHQLTTLDREKDNNLDVNNLKVPNLKEVRKGNTNSTAQFLKALTRVKQNNFVDSSSSHLDKTTIDMKTAFLTKPVVAVER